MTYITHALFTGSRETNGYDLRLVSQEVLICITNNVHIIVGDAPGVDKVVIDTCNEQKYENCECHGAYSRMRHKLLYGRNFTHACSYPMRDRIMADLVSRAKLEGCCIAAWNGYSRGTIITAKACHGVQFMWLWGKPSQA